MTEAGYIAVANIIVTAIVGFAVWYVKFSVSNSVSNIGTKLGNAVDNASTERKVMHSTNVEKLNNNTQSLVLLHDEINGKILESISAQVKNQIGDAIRIALAEERERVANLIKDQISTAIKDILINFSIKEKA